MCKYCKNCKKKVLKTVLTFSGNIISKIQVSAQSEYMKSVIKLGRLKFM